MNKGAMTFFFSEVAINLVSEFVKLLLAFVKQIFDFILKFFKALISAISTIPKDIYLVLGSITIIGLIAYFWEDGSRKLNDLMANTGNLIRSTKEKTIALLSKISDLLEKIKDDETYNLIAKGAGFMLLTNLELLEETKRLEMIAINYTSE